MIIATQNLFEGAKESISELTEYTNQSNIDVFCLQETNNWDDGNPSQLTRFAKETGHPNSVFGDSNTEYKLSTLSRVPIISSEVHTIGFWHSAIHIEVPYQNDSLHVWNIHLDPRDEDHRLEEARKLVELTQTEHLVIIEGDFNSLKRSDNYPFNLASDFADQGIKKFGDGSLRYDVTDYLEEAGFVDVAEKLGNTENTVPTPANTDKFHAAKLRLDYIFVSKGLIQAVKSIKVVKSYLTDKISDHYPLIMELN
jgi:endonuclease/exonuclease/phosphatase family metal-dependent hydrolase